MGIFKDKKIKAVIKTSFNIRNDDINTTLVIKSTGATMNDDISYIDDFSREILTLSYDSVLIVGLGMGIIPQYIAENTTCSVIDVLEANTELLDWIKTEKYLNNKIKLITGDAFTYEINQTYDLIILDIWWTRDLWWFPQTEEELITLPNMKLSETDILSTKYQPNLNPNGYLYIPILDTLKQK